MYRENRIVMDTTCTITVLSPSREKAEEAVEAAFGKIEELEKLLNYFSYESEITKINRSAGIAPVKVSSQTLEIVKKAVDIAEYTNGAYDPTIGPVIKLWGFSSQSAAPSIPPENKIREAIKLVNYKKIHIDISKSEIFLEEKGMEIDLGGIAKGYAADMAVEVIKSKGIKTALVAVAGDIKGFGLKPNGQPWNIGIQNPKTEEDVFATLHLKDTSISTSGDYQRFFVKDGQRYHHILDPETGYPASGIISISVIAPDGFMADGLSTGIFVLGPEKGIKLLESLGLSGLIVDSSSEIAVTKDLKGKINFESDL
jgi:thiamine biosynthesis lipoprotein